jgi:hypothetical protein
MLAVMGVPFFKLPCNVFGFVRMIPAGCHGTNQCKSLHLINPLAVGFTGIRPLGFSFFPFCGFKSLVVFLLHILASFFRIYNKKKKIPIFFLRLSVKIHPKKHIEGPQGIHRPGSGKDFGRRLLPYALKMKIYLNSYPVLKTRLWVGENNEGH